MTDRSVLVRLRADISQFQRSMVAAGASAKGFAKDLEQADSRMANLVQTGLALAPALVPVGAAAVPAIAGLTLQLGLAAGAAGVAVLAFQGVGDGLKALNAYQLDPTKENFAKLQEAMDKLGPAGQEFVLSLDKMTPKLQELQALAEQGLLPDVGDSLNQLMELMPQARDMVGTFSTTLGQLASEGADNLTDPRWVDFFDYIDRTAGPVLLEMGRTFGNLTEGIAHTLQAFDPLSRDFSTGFLEMSRSFNDWSQGLDDSQGFQDFVDYVQTNGPKALDALGSLAGALIELVEAAAPVGSALLPAISALADGLGAIADSPVGPVLISTAAAIGVLGRSMAVLKAVGITPGENGKTGIIGRALGTDEIKKSLPTLGQVGTVFAKAGQSAKYASEETTKARSAVRNFTSSIKPAAGLVGGMALATSGLAEKTGFANTASLGLMGTIAGGWGAAIGAGVGLIMDFAHSNDTLEASIKAVQRSAKGTDLSAMASDYKNLLEVAQEASRQAETFNLQDFSPGEFVSNVKGVTGIGEDNPSKSRAEVEKAAQANLRLKDSLFEVQDAMGGVDWKKNADGTRLASTTTMDYQQTLNTTVAAFSAVGKTSSEALSFLDEGKGGAGWSAGVAAVKDYVSGLDSASGKSEAVASALSDLGNEMESNVTQADALKAALDSLFGVELNQSQATDAATVALKEMRKAVAAAGKDLLGNGDAALKARDGIRGYVSAQLAKAQADAAATGNGKQAAETLLRTRDNLVATARAAGLGEKAVAKLTAEMGLTPKNLATIVTQPGLLNAKQQVRALGQLYGLTPKQLQTFVTQPGMTRSKADIAALAQRYGMTPREVRTLIKALDNASPVIGRVRLGIAGVQSKTVTLTTIHRDVRVGGGSGISANPTHNASGGLMRGPGTGTSDDIPAYLSNGEYVIRAAAVNKYGTHMFDRLNAMHFADGGSVAKKPETPSQTKARLEKEKNERERARKDAAQRRQERRDALRSFDLTGDIGVPALRDAFRELRDDFHLGSKALRGLQGRAENVTRSYIRHQKALEDDKQKLDDLKSERASYSSSVSGAFTHDPFGNGVAGLMLQLEADRNDANTAQGLTKQLDKLHIDKGLRGALLASGDLNTLSQLASSPSQVRAASQLYSQTTAATSGLAEYAAAGQFDKQITAQSKLITAQTKVLHNLNVRINNIEAAVERGARAGSREGARARAIETTQRRKVKR